MLLRRMKEDVEELPQKEEVVIWVELTQQQRAYYRGLYEGCIGALLGGGSSKNMPQMRNLAMELRKLCCHPVGRWEGGVFFMAIDRKRKKEITGGKRKGREAAHGQNQRPQGRKGRGGQGQGARAQRMG